MSNLTRLAAATACLLVSTACGSEMLRTGRSAVYLVVSDVTLTSGGDGGGGASTGSLRSDVNPVFNDIATVTFNSVAKNSTVPTTAINDVTLTRYHVEYRRTDGRNTPGVDVPYGFDGGLSAFIPAGSAGVANFDIVRHQAKIEPPLMNLTGGGGLIFISTIAEVTFYGHDQNGNEISVMARMDIQFADFADQ